MADRSQRLSRRQQRLVEKNQNKVVHIQKNNLELQHITPKTENQHRTFEAYQTGSNVCLHGSAGTGKTFIAMYLALREILNNRNSFRKLIIVRSAQPTKQIGFLPGSEKQKLEVYEAAYSGVCTELFNRGDAYQYLKQMGIIEFHGTSFLRGTTIDNAIILLDESQSMSYTELKTVLTRVGENTKVLVCGDTKQDDLTSERYNEQSGLSQIMQIFKRMNYIETIEFGINDIVRSGFVKSFIIAENELNL